MAVDREQWAERFTELPHWTCPTCGKGHFTPLNDKMQFIETGPSAAAHDHEAWEPEWILKRFAGFLQCSMPGCGEIAAVSGTSPSDFIEDWEAQTQFLLSRYEVKSIDPAPLPIRLPDATPDAVSESVKEAAALIWTSAEAAANQIRVAVEHMMDDLGVAATTPTGKALTLHKRIEEFQKTDAENGDVLLATKWLGNSGSHVSGLNREDVLDAFDMIEFVLENRYGTTKKTLLAKVAAVNAKKGPINPKKKP